GSEATAAFTQAQAEGVGPLATLGLGAAALAQGQFGPATAKLTEARDSGTAEGAGAAHYGLAVIAFQPGGGRGVQAAGARGARARAERSLGAAAALRPDRDRRRREGFSDSPLDGQAAR